MSVASRLVLASAALVATIAPGAHAADAAGNDRAREFLSCSGLSDDPLTAGLMRALRERNSAPAFLRSQAGEIAELTFVSTPPRVTARARLLKPLRVAGLAATHLSATGCADGCDTLVWTLEFGVLSDEEHSLLVSAEQTEARAPAAAGEAASLRAVVLPNARSALVCDLSL